MPYKATAQATTTDPPFRGSFFDWRNNLYPRRRVFFGRLHRSVYQSAFKFKISFLTQQASACVRLSPTEFFLSLKTISQLNSST
jgi:hypothetical protein